MINRSEYETKRQMSPLQRLYNIEKTLFPNMKTTKSDINNFEKTLIEIYSERRKDDEYGDGFSYLFRA